MNTQKEKINASVIHILNFSYLEMMKSAFALAAQTEPWVTKGLKAPGYMFKTDELQIGCVDLEVELLSHVEDRNVILLLKIMERVRNCKKSFEKINGIDFLDYIVDDEIYRMALNVYVDYDDRMRSYKQRVQEDCEIKYLLYLNIWRCTEVLRTQVASITDEQENVFNAQYFGYLEGKIKSEDTNAQLLFDLMADLDRN
jgi:hypothetical protein